MDKPLAAQRLSRAIWIPLFAAIVAFNPLAIDMYLPAMPGIADDFGVEISLLQYSLSSYLVGFACGILLFGPISDALGRRPMVLFGVSGFCIVTSIIPFISDPHWFILLRFAQAFLGSAATVSIPPTIKALLGKQTAKGLSYVAMVMMTAPMIAPAIGSFILLKFEWRVIFWVLMVYAVLILILAYKFFPTINVDTNSGISLGSAAEKYKKVLKNTLIRPYLLSIGINSIVFFGYLTSVSFIYIDLFKLTPQAFSLYFAIAVVGLMLAQFCNGKLVGYLSSEQLFKFAMRFAFLMALSLGVGSYLNLGILGFVVPITLIIGSLAIANANAEALILLEFDQEAGTATAVIGALRFGLGSASGAILGLTFNSTIWPYVILVMLSVVLVLWVSHRGSARTK